MVNGDLLEKDRLDVSRYTQCASLLTDITYDYSIYGSKWNARRILNRRLMAALHSSLRCLFCVRFE